MSEFEAYECANCGSDFKAYPDANAAQNEYCSPRCESENRGSA